MDYPVSDMSLQLAIFITVIAAFAVSAAIAPVARWLGFRLKIVDEPTGGRKIHQARTALLGGLSPFAGIVVGLIAAYGFADGKELHPAQVIGFGVALLILLIGGILDDRYNLPPIVQFIFPLFAALAVVASGSAITIVTNPFGGTIGLSWIHIPMTRGWSLDFPSDLLSIVWLLVVTYAMKFLDGLDGLVAGMTVIGAALIAGLASSFAYFQPTIALLALTIAAAYLGFLPWNRSGSLFLGESGSTIAGFSLGVLAIISGAKVATASAALGVPLVDVVLVILDRLARGTSPFRGDSSHLHFRLLSIGFTPRAAVRIIWTIALTFGLIALTLQTKGKIFLLTLLIVVIAGISTYAKEKSKKAKS